MSKAETIYNIQSARCNINETIFIHSESALTLINHNPSFISASKRTLEEHAIVTRS